MTLSLFFFNNYIRVSLTFLQMDPFKENGKAITLLKKIIQNHLRLFLLFICKLNWTSISFKKLLLHNTPIAHLLFMPPLLPLCWSLPPEYLSWPTLRSPDLYYSSFKYYFVLFRWFEFNFYFYSFDKKIYRTVKNSCHHQLFYLF